MTLHSNAEDFKIYQLKGDEKYLSATTLYLRKCAFFGVRLFLSVFKFQKKFIFQEYLMEHILTRLKCNILAFRF